MAGINKEGRMGVTAGRLYVLQHIPHFDLIQQPQQYMQIGKWVSRLLSLRSMGIKPVAAPTVS